MNAQERESLKTIVGCLWRPEQKNFTERERTDGAPPDDHIFSHL
jgi:hypothetical protein